jgi:response regulator RpfG family c-di-GMP phosphodiesterase
MNFATLHPPLIADPDPTFLQKLSDDQGATLAPPITVATAKALEDQLEHGRYVFSGIFINLEIAGKNASELLSKIRKTRPSTPIYLISSQPSKLTALTREQLRSLTVEERLTKPFNYMQVLKRVTAAQTPESQQIQYSDDKVENGRIEATSAESEYIPVLTSKFLAGSPSHFSLYIRLADDRFIKILREGDALGHDRLEFYRNKSIEQFYIRKNSFDRFLKHCHSTLMSVLADPSVGLKEKTQLTLNHGQQVMTYLKARNISPAAMKHAQDFVSSVLKLTELIELEKNVDLKKLLSDPEFRDHSSTTTLVSGLIGSKLGLRGEKMISLLGAASFLHDIGIPSADIKFIENDTSAMNPEELALYHAHPTHGAEIIRSLGSVEPIAIQAIAQHHERRNRRGFPEQLGIGQINLIAEIVGISDEWIRTISLCSRSEGRDPLKEIEESSFDGFSAQVVQAFKDCFGRF